jgi:hypothetical protein
MAKKEILIFTRNAPRIPKDVIKLPNYTIIKYLEDAIENCDYKYPRITAFVTADQRIIDIEELFWTGAFASLDECEKFFTRILDSYWQLASKNKFLCILAILEL